MEEGGGRGEREGGREKEKRRKRKLDGVKEGEVGKRKRGPEDVRK